MISDRTALRSSVTVTKRQTHTKTLTLKNHPKAQKWSNTPHTRWMDVISCVLAVSFFRGSKLSWCHHWHTELKASWEKGEVRVFKGRKGRKERSCSHMHDVSVCVFTVHVQLWLPWSDVTDQQVMSGSNTHTCMRCKRACWSRWSLFQWRIHQHEFTDMKSTLREMSVGSEGFVSTRVSLQPAWREPDAIPGPQSEI